MREAIQFDIVRHRAQPGELAFRQLPRGDDAGFQQLCVIDFAPQ